MGSRTIFHVRGFVTWCMKQQKNKLSLEELNIRMSYPLEAKIHMSKMRIRQFIREHGEDGVYISYSGGKDSDVLLHLCRSMYPDLIAVFIDTPMEFPQVREHAETIDNLIRIRPKKNIKEIIKENGFCFPSKETATLIKDYRKGLPYAIKKINGLDKDGNESVYRSQFKKWKALAESEYEISNGCCIEMKEKPAIEFEKETGRCPILGIRAEESSRRKNAYLKTGCISYGNRPTLKCIAFWTEQDILQYIRQNDIRIASPYGEIVEENRQMCLPGFEEAFPSKLKLTGEPRLGCMFCCVGCHLDYKDGKFQKFERLRKFNEPLYNYCMKELGVGKFLKYVEKNFVKGD